jgi:hypothetical protein
MPFCHGQGSTDPGGCCYVNGAICPHHKSAAELLTWIDSLGLTGQRKTRALAMAQGVQHACGIALQLIAQDPSLINARATFENLWNTHPDYIRDVRPAWVEVEQRMGLPVGAFQCSTWKGASGSQCCFSETTVVNEQKASSLSATAVTIRRAGGL